MHVADQPAPGHVAHDVLDRAKGQCRFGLVMHHQEDAGDELDYQHEQREHAKDVPEVEVLGDVVLAHVVAKQLGQGETVVHPVEQLGAARGVRGNFVEFSHGLGPQAFLSSPMSSLLSERYI